jgi:energy-coupling factor transport system permease protein
MHPGAWLVWVASAALVAVLTTNPFYLIPLVAVCWLVHSARREPGPQARNFRVFVLFALFALFTRTLLVVFSEVTLEAFASAALEGARLATLLIVFGTFNSVSDPFGVLKLSPRRFHEPALAAALALSIAPRMIDSARRVREAQRMRGLDTRRWSAWPALAVPVLENGMEEALVLAESMDARGHGRGRRTRYRPQHWSAAATFSAVAALAAAVSFLAVAASDGLSLAVSTYPLSWPSVQLALVAAVVALAAPSLIPERTPR